MVGLRFPKSERCLGWIASLWLFFSGANILQLLAEEFLEEVFRRGQQKLNSECRPDDELTVASAVAVDNDPVLPDRISILPSIVDHLSQSYDYEISSRETDTNNLSENDLSNDDLIVPPATLADNDSLLADILSTPLPLVEHQAPSHNYETSVIQADSISSHGYTREIWNSSSGQRPANPRIYWRA